MLPSCEYFETNFELLLLFVLLFTIGLRYSAMPDFREQAERDVNEGSTNRSPPDACVPRSRSHPPISCHTTPLNSGAVISHVVWNGGIQLTYTVASIKGCRLRSTPSGNVNEWGNECDLKLDLFVAKGASNRLAPIRSNAPLSCPMLSTNAERSNERCPAFLRNSFGQE